MKFKTQKYHKLFKYLNGILFPLSGIAIGVGVIGSVIFKNYYEVKKKIYIHIYSIFLNARQLEI